MKIEVAGHRLEITREEGDTRCSSGGYSDPESRLLYHVKQALNARGYDLIKKRMWKDGHLVADEQQYLRTRSKRSKGPHVYIWNPSWSVYDAAKILMEAGSVTLAIERDVFK
jgi:hypothetical protein